MLNGIVENYRDLRERLRAAGHVFSSETDAETVSHLIEEHYDGDLVEATRLAFNELEGHFAFVAIHRDHPGLLVGARHQCPLVVGVGDGETFLASNAAAFLRETREVHFPEDGDLVAITRDGAAFVRADDGSAVERELVELDWDDESAEKAGFETFMLKEIYEQPEAVAETIGDRVRHGRLELDGLARRRRAEGAAPHRHPLRGHVVPRRGRRAATRSRSGPACRSSTTSPPSGSTATPCSTGTRS